MAQHLSSTTSFTVVYSNDFVLAVGVCNETVRPYQFDFKLRERMDTLDGVGRSE